MMPVLQPEHDEEDVSGGSGVTSPATETSSPALSQSTQSPRRSGRKVRQRILYGHHPSPSARRTPQQWCNTSKEIPVSESEEEEADETREETSEREGSDDSDLEIPVKAASAGRGQKRLAGILKATPVAKRPKAKQAPTRKSPQKRSRKLKGGSDGDDGQGTLFDIVKAGKGALRAVVDDWIESYHADKETGMVDLIQFFIQCCGCKGTVTPKMLEEDENVNAIRQLTEQFDEDSHEYPLIMTGQAYKKFRANFVQFVDSLIQQCQHSIIYDEYMLDTLVSWLIRLSDSQVRAFRHTSTLAGMKLVSALIHVAKRSNVELDNTQRQLDSESHKVSSKKANEKIEMLQNKRQEIRQNISDLEDMMNFIFQGMFVHRYRDARYEIRALCIAEIGEWMKNYSTYFLSDKFLKYTVWSLHDKIGEVRLKALLALRGLYETDGFLPQLEPLTERFKERLVAMTLDKENEVAVEAVKLVTILFKCEKLDEEECQQVEFLVFCTSRNVARAAGEFLKQRIIAAGKDELKKANKSKRGRKPDHEVKAVQLRKLIEFFLVSEVHNHAAYLVDSLWETLDLLKDWKHMTDNLLDESDKQGLSDKEEMALIDIMVCACQQASSGLGPPGRAARKGKEKRTALSDKKDLSGHFMKTLPELLNKFGTDVENATNLVSLPQYFDLEEYGQRRLGKYLDELLAQLNDIVEKHSDPNLLDECGKSMKTLTDNEFTLASSADVCKNKLIDSFVGKFKENLKDGLDADDDDDQERFALHVNLTRINSFYKSHNLNKWDLYDDLSYIIELATKESVPDEILELTLSSTQMLLMWSLVDIDTDNPEKHEVRLLKRRVSQFMSQCDEVIQFGGAPVQRAAFICLCDLLVIFAKQLKHRAPTLTALVYEADNSMQVRLRDFVISHVFTDLGEDELEEEDDEQTDASAEELNKKRIVLAAFCKLVAFNVIEMKLVAPVFGYLIKAYSNFGDLIRHTMSKCRELQTASFARTLLLSLQQEFETLKDEEDGSADAGSKEFTTVRELAHKFALSCGVDNTKPLTRECVVTLHREGIVYSLRNERQPQSESYDAPPSNLGFLDILNEFTFKLIQQDRSGKGGVLSFLDEQAKKLVDKKGGQWSPLITYRNGLAGHDNEEEGQPKGSRAKRKLPMEGDDSRQSEWITSKQTRGTAETQKQKQKKPKAPRGRPPKSTVTKSQQTELTAQKPTAKPMHPEDEGKDDISSESGEWSQEEPAPQPDPSREESQTSDRNTEESDSEEQRSKETMVATTKQQKRKREELSQSDEGDKIEEEMEEDDQDFESVPLSSQRSWLSSQKTRQASKKARISYSKKDTSGVGRRRLEDVEDEEEIEEYESDEDLEVKKKTPVRVRREKRELPDAFFGDSQEEKDTEDDSLLEAAM